ncbi:restriction endonuclease [Pseudomonas sp. GX19020]|uniref:restriction endonuclease n=1 Tax=Pseudomonas sp. GX19020 TaxID=2942277 RepID=UPI00201999D8|nr:restriction endonuclease [Pseudomonas sp. GX19020]MCL4066702.1 restriction endonuclease [Pseudomonas sp. GX19020]
MKRPEIIRSVFSLPPVEGEFSIDALCLMAIEKSLGHFTIDHEEKVSKCRKSLYSDLKMADYDHHASGGILSFSYTDERFHKLRWNTSSKGDKRIGKKIRDRSAAVSWIESLNDCRDYEYLGGLPMKKLGASKVFVTPAGNEFGIDFLAIVPAFSKSDIFMSKSKGTRVVGQSKLYRSAVTRDKIQSFNDVMSSIRNNKAELIDILPAWFRSSNAPIVGFFVAHSGYQSGARISAEQNGYTLIDSLCASEIISCCGKMDHVKNAIDLDSYLWLEIAKLRA